MSAKPAEESVSILMAIKEEEDQEEEEEEDKEELRQELVEQIVRALEEKKELESHRDQVEHKIAEHLAKKKVYNYSNTIIVPLILNDFCLDFPYILYLHPLVHVSPPTLFCTDLG